MRRDMKQSCNSFDVFDTLIGRWYYLPESIFYEIEREKKFHRFVYYRKKSQRIAKSRSLNEIYDIFQKLTSCNDEEKKALKKFELLLEKKRSFPIQANANQVQSKDIAISDMYLSQPTINYLLRKNNINMHHDNLHVSATGKSSGTIFEQLKKKYFIRTHFGNDLNNDVLMPEKGNINSEFFNCKMNGIENYFLKNGFEDIALLSRAVRLMNPYHKLNAKKTWDDTANINLPVLILYSFEIYKLCQKKQYKYILFSQRDCCHLVKIFKCLFPNINNTKVFYVSRKCYYNPSETFLNYAKPLLEDSLVVDLAFSGRSYNAFLKSHPINFEVVTLVAHNQYFRVPAKYRRKMLTCHYMINGLMERDIACIERLNLDVTGTTIDFSSQPIREHVEYPRQNIRYSHEAIDKACKLLKQGFYIDKDVYSRKKIKQTISLMCKYAYYFPAAIDKNSLITSVNVNKDEYTLKKNIIARANNKLFYLFYYNFIKKILVRKKIINMLFETPWSNRHLSKKIKKMEKKEHKILSRFWKKQARSCL